MSLMILAFVFCLALSVFFSIAEMAYISVNKLKFRELSDAGDARAQKILRLLEHPHHLLTTLLIGNNIVNITAIALLTYELEKQWGLHSEWLVTAIMAPTLIIFGETVPKDYGRLRAQQFLLNFSGAIAFFIRLMRPLVFVVLKTVDFFLGSLSSVMHKSIFVDEEEFRLLIEEGTRTGVLNPHEKKLIDTILDFGRIHVDSVMTPLEKVAKLDISSKIREVKDLARRSNARMILIYEEIPSIVMGMIYVFDVIFEDNEDQGLKNFLRSPTFLPWNTSIEKAFLMLQHKRQSFAVVTDDKGEAIGVVPAERLLAI